MSVKEFERTYKSMLDEQLIELTAQVHDLVPEAKTALAGELRRRGINPSDIEKQVLGNKKQSEPPAPPETVLKPEDEAIPHSSCKREGPVPPGWVRIPSFGIGELAGVAEQMESSRIPYEMLPAQGFGCRQFLLAVPPEKLKECVDALKEYHGLHEGPPDPFSGECPACGTKLEKVQACTECGIELCIDAWDAMSGHPFLQFLAKNGFARKTA